MEAEEPPPDEEWPKSGELLRVDGRTRRVVLDKASPLYHVGMYLVFARQEEVDPSELAEGQEDGLHEVVEVEPGNSAVRLLNPVPEAARVGSPYFTVQRQPPANLAEFRWLDCALVLRTLDELCHDPQLLDPGPEGAGARRALLALNNKAVMDTLAAGGPDEALSQQEVLSAFTALTRQLHQLRQKCEALGVFGPTLTRAVPVLNLKRYEDSFRVLVRVAEYELGRALMADEVGRRPVAAAYTSALLSPFAAAKPCAVAQLMEHFLQRAALHDLRNHAGVVYVRVETVVDRWLPPDDNPLCVRCGTRKAAFAETVLDARARCARCRLPDDVDLRLVRDDNPDRPGVRRIRKGERAARTVATQAWRPATHNGDLLSVRNWMHHHISSATEPELYNLFLEYYTKIAYMFEEFVERADNPRFPALKVSPHCFSFQNGLYDVEALRFYPYGTQEAEEGGEDDAADGTALYDICCVNHLDVYFDPYFAQVDLAQLAVPGYDAILASQSYEEDMVYWLDVFLGRLLYPIGKHDKWEKLVIIKGWAATGKSTVAKALVALLGPSNVGTIPANCEEQWALSSVKGKRLWLCTELKKDWRFPTAVLQSMVSGEMVMVHRKHKEAEDIPKWTTQGMAVGNEEPIAWINDPGNAMYRRIMPFPFEKTPKTQNPEVARMFMSSLPQFLVRACRRYREAATAFGHQPIDDHLPGPLRVALDRFRDNTQPIVRFLKSGAGVELAPPVVLARLTATAGVGGAPPAEEALRREWRINVRDLHERLKLWWNDMGLQGKGTMPCVMTADDQNTTEKLLGVKFVPRNNVTGAAAYVIGIKAVQDAREPSAAAAAGGGGLGEPFYG